MYYGLMTGKLVVAERREKKSIKVPLSACGYLADLEERTFLEKIFC